MLRIRLRSNFMSIVGTTDVMQSFRDPSHDELSAPSEGHSVMHSVLLSSLVTHPQLLSTSVLHSNESLGVLSFPLQSSVTESQLVSQDLADVSTLSLLGLQSSKHDFAQSSPVLRFTVLILEIYLYTAICV